MNVLFPIGLLVRLLSVWNIILLRMSIFTVNVIFPFAHFQNSCALCDNCLVYFTSLVSNNYLGSTKCSVDNNFHFSSECLFHLLFYLDYVSAWNIIQLRMSIFTVNFILPFVPIQKSSALCDNCLVYTTSSASNN